MIKKTRHELALGSLNRFVEEMRALDCSDKEILEELKSYMKGDVEHGKRP